jgi:hypothetical protein
VMFIHFSPLACHSGRNGDCQIKIKLDQRPPDWIGDT